MSQKATIVILWACVIAGAAVASEKHRTNGEYKEHTVELQEVASPIMRARQKCNSSNRLT